MLRLGWFLFDINPILSKNLSQTSTSTIRFFFFLAPFKCLVSFNMLLHLASLHYIYPRIICNLPWFYLYKAAFYFFSSSSSSSLFFFSFPCICFVLLFNSETGLVSQHLNINGRMRIPSKTIFLTAFSTSWNSTELIPCSMYYDSSFLNYTHKAMFRFDSLLLVLVLIFLFSFLNC